MRIYFVQLGYIPSENAAGLAVMQQCSSLAGQGNKVYFIYWKKPFAPQFNNKQICEYYSVDPNFTLVGIPVIPGCKIPSFCILFFFWLLFNKKGFVYTRAIEVAAISSFLRRKTILEFHNYYKNYRDKIKASVKIRPYLLLINWKYIHKTIAISESLKKTVEQGGKFSNIQVIPSGANIPTSSCGLSLDKTNYDLEVGYTGTLERIKGIEIILALAVRLPTVRFHIVGGSKEDVNLWSDRAQQAGTQNIIFYGHIRYNRISIYLNTFDVCLLPSSLSKLYNEKYDEQYFFGNSSPLKLFDYMAHGKAIICSAYKEFQEILSSENAIFCDPYNIDEWVNAILNLKNDEVFRTYIGKAVAEKFENTFSWERRIQRVFQ